MIKYARQYLLSAETICKLYDGSIPLSAFLKQYFQQYKKFGSKDRRYISHLCYCYYRLGHALKEQAVLERIKAGVFLCDESAEWQSLYSDTWINNWNSDLQKRIDFMPSVFPDFSVADIFPWIDELSEGIEWNDLAVSHFIQPDLFLRIRPMKEKAVLEKLNTQQISFKQLSATTIALPNTSKIDTILETDREVVIQDLNSQRVAEFVQLITYDLRLTTSVWDCCAASGGKSILAYDMIPKIELTVSDIRPSIIHNLKKRFECAGIKNYHSFIADLSNHTSEINNQQLILCDAPCTGSGTWGRTPEQLYFFSREKISGYAALQKKIVRNIIPSLADGGYLLYITCSVFKKENEEMIAMIENEFSLRMIKNELLKGYGSKADSMFVALFKK